MLKGADQSIIFHYITLHISLMLFCICVVCIFVYCCVLYEMQSHCAVKGCVQWSLCYVERNRSTTGSSFSPYDSFRKSSIDRPKSGTPDKRDSWNAEDIGTALDSFRPVTITISSFFKQVAITITVWRYHRLNAFKKSKYYLFLSR